MRKFKKVVAYLLVAALCLQPNFGGVTVVSAETAGVAENEIFIVGDYKCISNTDGTNTVTVGDVANDVVDLEVPQEIEDDNGTAYAVTQIGFGAEYTTSDKFKNIEKVTLPATIKVINDAAFKDCTKLGRINLREEFEDTHETSTVELSIGAEAFSNCQMLERIELNRTTSIGTGAFRNCTALEKAVFPNSLKSIGESAFSGCVGIMDINLPYGIQALGDGAFSGCSKLEEIFFVPKSRITKIGTGTFSGCTKLRVIYIPSAVTEIGANAFKNCTNLTYVYVLSSTDQIAETAFEGCGEGLVIYAPADSKAAALAKNQGILYEEYTYEEGLDEELIQRTDDGWMYYVNEDGTLIIGGYNPGMEDNVSRDKAKIPGKLTITVTDGTGTKQEERNVTTVGFGPFNCTGDDAWTDIKEIKIPDSVKRINASAFEGCGKLERIDIPEGVTSIGSRSFVDCSALTQITLPSTIKTIEENAFMYSGLTDITIPEGVTSIGAGAFSYSDELTEVTLPDSLTRIEDSTFAHCYKLKKINIPEHVTSIESNAFWSCIFAEVKLPDSLVTIGSGAFMGCTQLKTINIPKGVTDIEGWTFHECSSLKEIYIPVNVKKIWADAFSECTSLEKIHIPGGVTIPDYEEEYVFTNCDKLTIYTQKDSFIEQYAIKYEIPVAYEDLAAETGCQHGSTGIENATTATCTEAGYSGDTYCLECKTKLKAGETIPAKGHQWNDGVVTEAATALENGVKTFTCTVCGATKTEVLEATGVTVGMKLTDSTYGNGYTVTSLKGKNGTVEYAEPVNSDVVSVSVPATVKFGDVTYQVTAIAPKAFKNCKELKTVTVGKNVTAIGGQAFYNCKKLKNITIKTTKLTEKTVGSKAFKGIYAKAVIKVPKSKVTAYKKLLKKKGVGNKVSIKK